MADFLIKHLKKKEDEHSALGMLVNQWGFDEKLIPKALQTVGSLFPHYSRHDESHSRQILVNIERLLGQENIDKLTATDTWLLLESAYWHDIGMVVPQKDIINAIEDKGFQQYIDDIRDTPNHELHRFCLSFNSHDISQCFNGADSPIDAVDKFRQLMAEWFRRQHANRATTIIQAPWESAGISSPRTELIPARLFKLLGRICYMHGLPFDKLLAPHGLPFREAGLAHEDCHPRFVACLLRMGDLLDLDDNRFCPVMQSIEGENRPKTSKAHEDKHAGIQHLRIDRERIEITAECSTVDGYLETFKWFDWLKQEIQNQMSHWQDIVPAREFGLLPTLGDIIVSMRGEEEQILKEGQRPQFSIDADKAIKLLQGHNLYSNKFACVRELLQNAVDATLLQLWLTQKDKIKDWKDPFSDNVQAILKDGCVEVSLIESVSQIDTPKNHTLWNLRIKDNGTGISRDDLAYMLSIGGSQKNSLRQEKIKSMRKWMRPSGAFGIGFQSVFMICDVVKLRTKSVFSNEILEITMHSPTGVKEGLVLIKPLENDISHDYGTILDIFFSLKKITRSYNISYGVDNRHTLVDQFINAHDPILDDTHPIEAAQLADQIQIFTENSMLPISGTLKTLDASSPDFPLGSNKKERNSSIENWRIVTIGEHEVALQYNLTLQVLSNNNKTLYRGQTFKHNVYQLPFITIGVNLLSGKAGEWLTANRDNLIGSAGEDFSELVLAALEKLVEKDLASLDSKLKPMYSLFLEAMSVHYGDNWSAIASKVEGEWLNLDILGDTNKKTYQEFLKKDSWTLAIQPHSHQSPISTPVPDLVLNNQSGELFKTIIFYEFLKNKTHTIQIIERKEHAPYYQLKNEPQELYDKETLATHLITESRTLHRNQRFLLSTTDIAWAKLYLKNDITLSASLLFEIHPQGSNVIILPFLFYAFNSKPPFKIEATNTQLEALCKWVQPKLKDASVSLEEIRSTYDELISYIDNKIMLPSEHSEEWRKARGIH